MTMVNGQAIKHDRALALVPTPAPDARARISFCSRCGASRCGARGGSDAAQPLRSRVCEDCGLGLMLDSHADVAPPHCGSFLVIDGGLSVCAVSASAELVLAAQETDAVNRHITELLVPADAETQVPTNLAAALSWAARGDETPRNVVVRPANTFGVRLTGRVASCGPQTAALLVFD